MKAVQLPLDNTMEGIFPCEYELLTPNHVIWAVKQCRSLQYFEKSAPERIDWVCYTCERQIMIRYLINPKLKVRTLKLPPRKNPEDIACKWEVWLEE